MYWTEWAAIALCVLFAILVLLLISYFAPIAWDAIACAWKNRQPTQTTETPFGTFTKGGRQWSGTIETNGKELVIRMGDVDGLPNPEWLRKLPALMETLPCWERIARQSVDRLTEKYRLYSISDGSIETADFVLGFNYDEETWGLTVSVVFYGGHVASWSGGRWIKKRCA